MADLNPTLSGEEATGGVLLIAERPHVCHPGWEEYVISCAAVPGLDGQIGVRPLTVWAGDRWACDCGRWWVAVAMKPWESPGLLMNRVSWRREHWWERRRRPRSSRSPE